MLLKIWQEAESSVDYIVALWVSLLFITAAVGFAGIIFLLLTQPERFSTASFGIFDYI